MPANLPPQYYEVERQLKTADSNEEKIAIYEELLSMIPKHKGTEKVQAMLKTKMAKLKSAAQKKSGPSKQGPSHTIKKAGAGQIVIIGAPNAGKSMLVKALTNADPQVSDYPFTTHAPSPAMMPYENIQVQLIDTPPITPDYMEVYHQELVKTADGVIILIDPTAADPAGTLQALMGRLQEKRIEFIGPQEEPGRGFLFRKKTLMVVNKSDLPAGNLDALKKMIEPQFESIPVSASTGEGLPDLKERIFALLDIVRAHSKAPGKKAGLEASYTLKKGSKVLDMARIVHKDFTQKLKFARIWGKGKYRGQKVNRDYVLQDEDVIELHI
ncbi:MAG: 50S ribosome-binding GTPase [Candidatus Aminicenantes bacterium]|nr:50S ribosome-binding GTPase [Candidatus Aminicenantes bacterium]